MNKLFYSLLVTILVSLSNLVTAQSCGNSGTFPCYATNFPDTGGFENPDSVPCIIKGVAYDTTIQLTMFTNFFAAGANQEVDSIQFLSFGNLPCGLCWSSNNTYDRFAAGVHGCIRISGTTDDSVGQYKLAIKLEAWINHIPTGIIAYPFTVDASGIKMYLRVSSSNGACTPVDTNSSFVGLTASCVTGLPGVDVNAAEFSISPNPMNSNAVVSFLAEKETRYTARISDVEGRLISNSEIEATPGTNKMTIEKGTKRTGLYFLSLTGGGYTTTRKFAVIE